MNAAKVTLTATVVAAVFGLALSFGASPATAHCKGKHAEDPFCDGVAEGRAQTFSVELIEGPNTMDAITTGDFCIGSSKSKKVTDAKFPPHSVDCNSITLDTAPNLTDPILHLCQVNINHANRPDRSVTMFFTSGQGVVGGALCPDEVYKGEFNFKFDEVNCAAVDTCVEIDQSGLTLEKLIQPDKGTEADGKISVGTIVWTPCGELNPLC